MNDDLARRRFLALQLIRLSGIALVIAGMLVVAGKIDLPREAGIALLLVGLFDAMFIPILFARRWKSPPP